MSTHVRGNVCGNKEALIAYVYGECDGAEREALETHLLACLTCATELRGLRGARSALGEWTVPDVPLDIRIAPPVARRAWWWPVPVWAQAAAAVLLVLAAAAGLANLEVRYGPEGLLVRTGWTRPGPPPIGAMSVGRSASDGGAAAAWRSDLDRLARELRSEFAAREGQPASARAVPVRAPAALNEGDVLRRVRAMIDQSEQRVEERQQRELAMRIQQLIRDVETTRRADLVRIEQSIGRMQVDTGAAIVSQRDWTKNYTNSILRTSQRQPR